jgi:hypothetical protein
MALPRSTSLHRLSADRGLPAPQAVLYVLLNWLNNRFPDAHVDPALEGRSFVVANLDAHWTRLHPTSSPSRKLSDLFWMTLPWAAMREELGEIHGLDTGCGSGNYGLRLLEWSGGALSSYTGTDLTQQPNWKVLAQQHAAMRFVAVGAADIGSAIPPGTNFFMSQSAVEHIVGDLGYFEQIRDYARRAPHPVIQIHLFPSSACLRLYRLHGVRQYTPRTVSKISRLFSAFSYSVLFGLGGAACNALHHEFITRADRRDRETDLYERRSLAAIERDMQTPQSRPAFYALWIHSNWKRRLL